MWSIAAGEMIENEERRFFFSQFSPIWFKSLE